MGAEQSAPYDRLVVTRGLGGSHRRLLAEVAPGARVLDVGCATGYLAARLTEQGCSVVGFERDRQAAAAAEQHCEVIVGDIESSADRARIPPGFDVVLMGDVLEHLVDPWTVLGDMRRLLAPEGRVIVSVPNVAAWPVRLSLLVGRFRYADHGLLDRTHLRFFTRTTALDLARSCGYEIERVRTAHLERRPGPLRRTFPRPMSIFDRVTARLLPGLFAQQFVLRLRPRS